MPIYQYKCMTCGHEFQDAAILKCESCGSANLMQAHAVTNFQCRGRGYSRDPIDMMRNRFDRK